jgi:hypothetical protein
MRTAAYRHRPHGSELVGPQRRWVAAAQAPARTLAESCCRAALGGRAAIADWATGVIGRLQSADARTWRIWSVVPLDGHVSGAGGAETHGVNEPEADIADGARPSAEGDDPLIHGFLRDWRVVLDGLDHGQGL